MKSLWLASAGVVVDEPGVDLGAELPEALETPPVERGTPTFLQGGALEPFAHRVVVRGPRWGSVMGDLERLEMRIERVAELGPVVGEHPGDADTETAQLRITWSRNRSAISVFEGPRNTWQIAHRVAVSTAVSCQTFPTPLRFPM